MRRAHLRTASAALAALSLTLLGCEADEDPISPDPEELEEPADAPEGAPDDGEPAEEGDGEPAVEGDTEGQFDPDDEDDAEGS